MSQLEVWNNHAELRPFARGHVDGDEFMSNRLFTYPHVTCDGKRYRLGATVSGVTSSDATFLAKIWAIFNYRATEESQGEQGIFIKQYFRIIDLKDLNAADRRLQAAHACELVLGEENILLKGSKLNWIKNTILVVNTVASHQASLARDKLDFLCQYGLEDNRLRLSHVVYHIEAVFKTKSIFLHCGNLIACGK